MPHANEPNPLLSIEHPIAFDQIGAEHVRPAVEVLLEDARRSLNALQSDPTDPTYDNTLAALERATERLGRAMGVVAHLESVMTSPPLREAYNAVQPEVSAFYSSIPLSAPLFARLQALAESPEAQGLSPTRARFLDKTLEEFEREGASLAPEQKKRLEAINVELSKLTTRFSQNVLDSTNAFELLVGDEARLAGLPERAIDAARQSAMDKGQQGFRFTLQEPSLIPLLTYLDDASLRERVHCAYYSRGTAGERDNRPLVAQILALRAERASLLGYDNFVDLVVSDRMAGDSGRVRDFLGDLERRTRSCFEDEAVALKLFRDELEGAGAPELSPWDVGYYAEKERRARFDFDEEALRPYFPLESVLTGLFELVHRLYGIVVEPTDAMPTWHPSVRAYRIADADGAVLGFFYADFFPREEKRGGAWMNALITGEPSEQAGCGYTPHVGLICANVTPPLEGASVRPALLGHREVETLFHEFGHLLHHLLSRVEVRSLAGTQVAWDFVELPSQIMENWCWERDSLDLFARHYESGEAIPDELFERMTRARTYRGGSAMMRQLGLGTVDLLLHSDFEPGSHGDVIAYSRGVLERFAPTPLPGDHAMIASFSHLFGHPVGYAGGYYSYKWAEVLDADAFSRFKSEGLFSPTVGGEFREMILARGDSRDPMELFRDFMGREPEIAPLLMRSGISG
ncbi:MAG: M3 family metallopeptidase [Myxococcales bacterium]|nr:M3 family metallopeptidase [Myxococcales bacterium]